jgi:hypothetical protein
MKQKATSGSMISPSSGWNEIQQDVFAKSEN